jgi:hypothetical protein
MPPVKPTKKNYSTQLAPLSVISLFLSFTEITLGVVATKTAGGIQVALAAFVICFPVLVAILFFRVLWRKPYVFYPPDAYANLNVAEYVDAMKDAPAPATAKTSDLKGSISVFGNPDRFELLFKASGETWSRSTKAMAVPGGCLVQVSTKFLGMNGAWDLAEAISFVPGVSIVQEPSGTGRFLA